MSSLLRNMGSPQNLPPPPIFFLLCETKPPPVTRRFIPPKKRGRSGVCFKPSGQGGSRKEGTTWLDGLDGLDAALHLLFYRFSSPTMKTLSRKTNRWKIYAQFFLYSVPENIFGESDVFFADRLIRSTQSDSNCYFSFFFPESLKSPSSFPPPPPFRIWRFPPYSNSAHGGKYEKSPKKRLL